MALGDNLFNYGSNSLGGYENAIGLPSANFPVNPNLNFGFGGNGGGGGNPSPPAKTGTFGFGNVVGAGIGVVESIIAGRNLKDLESQPMPGYSVGPELQNAYSQSRQLAKQGYTGTEKASFLQDVNRQQATNYQAGTQLAGGNLANAIGRASNAGELDSLNKFAASDAELHRQNIAQSQALAGQLQSQENLINQNKIQQRMQLEQQYGQALNSGLSNIGKNLNFGAIGGNLLNLAGAAAL